jgi:hypothetical protein
MAPTKVAAVPVALDLVRVAVALVKVVFPAIALGVALALGKVLVKVELIAIALGAAVVIAVLLTIGIAVALFKVLVKASSRSSSHSQFSVPWRGRESCRHAESVGVL